MRRCGLSALGFALIALSGATTLQTSTAQTSTGQAWPSKPIRIIIPFSPGSGTDIVGRTVAEQLQTQLGQTIIVENRVGAGGTIGVGAVAKAEPDGHTLLIHSTTHVVAATTYSNPGYDVARDFAGITPLVSLPNVLVVAPNKFKTVKDLVAAAKAKPGTINYASAGAGSAAHLNGERFRIATGLDVQHIPYKGGPEGLTAIIKGDVDFYFIPLPAARGLVAAGNLTVIAVSGSKRSPSLPDVPTTVEAGFPEFRIQFLGRDVRARRHAEGDRGQAQRGNREDFERSGHEGKARQGRRRPHAHDARRVRRLHQEGNRRECGAGEGRQDPDQLIPRLAATRTIPPPRRRARR